MNVLAPSFTDSIAAIASAPGRSERGIIRISGSKTLELIQEVMTVKDFDSKQARRYEGSIELTDGLSLPVELLIWPTERSFTGEPMAEIHCVGSPPLLNELLEMILTTGARPAERGEFTLRAFLSGRIDLIQAEAVLGVIDAAKEDQLSTALQQLAGGISSRIAEIREELLLHLADLEAGLDFVEEDIEFVQRTELQRRVQSAREFLKTLLAASIDRMQSTTNFRVVLAGLPNAGKSTLFNAIIESDHAIVSEIAGTTRDYLAAEIVDHGISYTLVDTAGWEDARDEIEAKSGHLRMEQILQADLILWCQSVDLEGQDEFDNQRLLSLMKKESSHVITVITKVDRPENESIDDRSVQSVSAKTGWNLDHLRNRIVSELSQSDSETEILSSTAARCRESLQHADVALSRAEQLADAGSGDELIAMELRDSLDHLGRIVGVVYTDDILDRIFSRFCIGK